MFLSFWKQFFWTAKNLSSVNHFSFLILVWYSSLLSNTIVSSSNVGVHESLTEQAVSSRNSSDLYLWGTSSNLSWNTSYHDWGILWFYPVPPGKCRDSAWIWAWQLPHTSVPIHYVLSHHLTLLTMSLNKLQIKINEPNFNQNSFILSGITVYIQTDRQM